MLDLSKISKEASGPKMGPRGENIEVVFTLDALKAAYRQGASDGMGVNSPGDYRYGMSLSDLKDEFFKDV